MLRYSYLRLYLKLSFQTPQEQELYYALYSLDLSTSHIVLFQQSKRDKKIDCLSFRKLLTWLAEPKLIAALSHQPSLQLSNMMLDRRSIGRSNSALWLFCLSMIFSLGGSASAALLSQRQASMF